MATISDAAKDSFRLQFEKKGRASISVPVEVTDENNTVTMAGTYEWFVQKIVK